MSNIYFVLTPDAGLNPLKGVCAICHLVRAMRIGESLLTKALLGVCSDARVERVVHYDLCDPKPKRVFTQGDILCVARAPSADFKMWEQIWNNDRATRWRLLFNGREVRTLRRLERRLERAKSRPRQAR